MLPKRLEKNDGERTEATRVAEQQKVAALRDRMRSKLAAVDHNTAAAIQAAIEYDSENLRSEFRPLANRNWKLIRKYGTRFGRAIAVLILVLIGLAATNYFLSDRQSRLDQRTHALAVNSHEVALSNCHNIATLAAIERGFINRQEKQTQALLEGGVTFGIPAARIPGLIAASERSQALFLGQLDALASRTCEAQSINAPSAPVGKTKPAKHKAKKAKPKRGAIPTTKASPPTRARTHHTPSVKSLPEHRRSRLRSAPTHTTPSTTPLPATPLPSTPSTPPTPGKPTAPPVLPQPEPPPPRTRLVCEVLVPCEAIFKVLP